jgi:hypothetical protein
MSNAFPEHSDCPVPSIEAIEGSLVSSCQIDDAPYPEFCFPFQDIPLIPPPSFDFGCYPLGIVTGSGHYNNCLVVAQLEFVIGEGPLGPNIAGNLLAALGSDVIKSAIAECSEFHFSGGVTYPNFAETGYCEPNFNFDFGIPCIPIKQATAGKFVQWQGPMKFAVTGGRTMTITNTQIDMPCDYNFSFNTELPCAHIEGKGTVFGSTHADDPRMDVKVTEVVFDDLCYYLVSIDLFLGVTSDFCVVTDVSVDSSGHVQSVSKLHCYFVKGVLMSTNSSC